MALAAVFFTFLNLTKVSVAKFDVDFILWLILVQV